MKVLALELSSPVGSVAFRDDEETRDFRTFPADRQDSSFFYENLWPVYQSDGPPDLIVVGLGPGSYAGVRIAVATAIGLRESCGASLRGLPSICAVEREEYLFLGDARRDSFFFAHVLLGQCLEGPTLATVEEIQVRLRVDPAIPVIATEPMPKFEHVVVENPSALRLAELAFQSHGEASELLEPIYLRPPYTTKPRE